MGFLKNFALPVKTTSYYESISLRTILFLMISSVLILLILFDLYFGNPSNPINYFSLSVILIAFWLSRKRYFVTSNILVLVCLNLHVFLLAPKGIHSDNVYLFYFPLGLMPLILFSQSRSWLKVLFIFIPLLLAFLPQVLDMSFLPPSKLNEASQDYRGYVNFFFAIVPTILVIRYILGRNEVTEKFLRRNEQDLKQSRTRFELAIQGSHAGIYEWNIIKDEVYNSPIWKNMLGFKEFELPNLNLNSFIERIHPDDKDFVAKAVKDHLDLRIPYSVEFRIRKKDSSYLWVSDNGLAVWDENGKPELMVGSLIDISERKMSEQKILQQNIELSKTNAELDQFIYRTSHDLRAPLASIMGLVQVGMKGANEAEVKYCFQMIHERATAQDNFIKEILDYARNARIHPELKKISLKGFLLETIQTLFFMEGSEKIKINVNISSGMEVIIDTVRMKSIFSNLVSNAIKYHDHKKPNQFIHINATKTETHWKLTVEDNGIGIMPDRIDKIFNMFYRGTEVSKGSGLGLFIVQETVQKLGGTIHVESQFGMGSTFTVTMPNSVA
jgi:PAS domain S-box-containing protein